MSLKFFYSTAYSLGQLSLIHFSLW